MPLITTLNEIKSHHPCESGWKKLLKHIGKTQADDEPINAMTVLESNGIKDAIWCLRCFDYRNYCLFLADVAESVIDIYNKTFPDDDRPQKAINAIRDWYSGVINDDALDAAAAYAAAAATAAAAAAHAAAAADDAANAADAAAAASAAAAAAHAAYAAAAYAAAAYASAAYADDAAAAYAAAAYAAAHADDAAAAYAAAAYAAAKKQKWKEIEQLFIKHFG
jgi:hypothetical protein